MKTVVNQVVAMADILKFSEEELTLLTNTTTLEEARMLLPRNIQKN